MNHIFQTKASSTITIPKEHHRYILGRGGTNLQDLETRTATQISIPKANDNTDKITITGPKDGIEKAVHELQLISDVQSKQVNSSSFTTYYNRRNVFNSKLKYQRLIINCFI